MQIILLYSERIIGGGLYRRTTIDEIQKKQEIQKLFFLVKAGLFSTPRRLSENRKIPLKYVV